MPRSAFGEWCQMPPPKFKSEWEVRQYDQRPVCGTGNRLNIKQDDFAWSGEQQGSCKIVGVDRRRWKPELYGEEKADPTRAQMYRVNCVGAGEFRFMEVPARPDAGPNWAHVIVVYFQPYPPLMTPGRPRR
jgi:hypothetical protein